MTTAFYILFAILFVIEVFFMLGIQYLMNRTTEDVTLKFKVLSDKIEHQDRIISSLDEELKDFRERQRRLIEAAVKTNQLQTDILRFLKSSDYKSNISN